MILDVDQDKIESVEEVELGEIRKTDSQNTDGLERFGVSQDPHDEEKVLSILIKRLLFLPFYNGC